MDFCDILVCHYPALGFLDSGFGSVEIKEYVLKAKPLYFVFGDNHGNPGILEFDSTNFVNASSYHILFK